MGTVSCATPITNSGDQSVQYTLHLQGLPQAQTSYQVIVQTYTVDASGRRTDYDDRDFGRCGTSAPLDLSLSVDTRAQRLSVYLVGSGSEPDFFDAADLTKTTGHAVALSYWLDYYQYFHNNGNVELGMSDFWLENLTTDTPVSIDFQRIPFRMFRVESQQASSYQALVSPAAGVLVRYAESLPTLVSGGSTANLSSFPSTELPGTGTWVYLLVRPVSYDSNASVTFTWHKKVPGEVVTDPPVVPGGVSKIFDVDQVITADGGATLLMAGRSSPDLRSWEVATGAFRTVKTFDSPIRQITTVGTQVYIATGVTLWRFTPGTENMKLMWNFGGTILGFTPVADTHMLVNDATGAWSSITLVRLSDFATLATKEWFVPASRPGLWVPEQNRAYFYADSFSPSDLYSLDVDLAQGTLGAYVDSPYHGSYSLANPLVRLGNQMVLMLGSGVSFRIDDTATASKIKFYSNLGSNFSDLLVGSDRLYALKGVATDIYGRPTAVKVQSHDLQAPHPTIDLVASWAQESPVALVKTFDGALVVNRAVAANSTLGALVVRKLTDADLNPTSPEVWAASRSLAGAMPPTGWRGPAGMPFRQGKTPAR